MSDEGYYRAPRPLAVVPPEECAYRDTAPAAPALCVPTDAEVTCRPSERKGEPMKHIELDLPDHMWKSRAEKAEAENARLRADYAKTLERLQDICERAGCPAGINRLDFIEHKLIGAKASRLPVTDPGGTMQKFTLEQRADGCWHITHEKGESIYPTTSYDTPRKAASRLLQLLDIGPVAPQTHPERVCIGEVSGGRLSDEA